MQTIPDVVLDKIAEHRPHLTTVITKLRATTTDSQSAQFEKHIAVNYLLGESHLSASDTWYLAQVAYGGPWGGDWERVTAMAARLGVTEGRIRQRIAAGDIEAIKRGKTWYVRRS